jgi:hypothetical protein
MQHSCYNPPVVGTCDVAQIKQHSSQQKPLAMTGLLMRQMRRLSQKIASATCGLLPTGFL